MPRNVFAKLQHGLHTAWKGSSCQSESQHFPMGYVGVFWVWRSLSQSIHFLLYAFRVEAPVILHPHSDAPQYSNALFLGTHLSKCTRPWVSAHNDRLAQVLMNVCLFVTICVMAWVIYVRSKLSGSFLIRWHHLLITDTFGSINMHGILSWSQLKIACVCVSSKQLLYSG